MSKSDSFENQLLLHIFNNSDIATVGDATGLRGSSTPGNLYLSLHTGDPGDAVSNGLAATETTYTGYARVAVARASGAGGWTVTGNSVSPTDDTDFGECTASPGGALTHFAVTAGTDGTGEELVLYYGTLTPNITMATGVIPRIKNTSTITES